MHGKWIAAGALATAGILAFALPVRAGDAHRLSMPSQATGAPTVGLVDDLKAVDTVKVHGYHGGYHGGYGGYHGYSHGYYGGYYGYGRSYYGGYGFDRGYYGGYGYYPHYHHHYYGYGYGYYPSFAYSGCYQPYYYSAPSIYYSTPSIYYYSTPSYYADPYLCPSAGLSGRFLSLNITTAPAIHRRIVEVVAAPAPTPDPVQSSDQTFPYDGGPRNPAPMPKAEPTPDARPAAPQVDDHSVSLPAKVASTLVYPAYGEQAVPPSAPRFQERGVLVKGEPVKKLAK